MAFNDIRQPEAFPQGPSTEPSSNTQDAESTAQGGPTDPGRDGNGRPAAVSELGTGAEQAMSIDARDTINAEPKKDDMLFGNNNATSTAPTDDSKTSSFADSKLKSTLSSFGIDPENEKVKGLLSKVTGASGIRNDTVIGDDGVGIGGIGRMSGIGGISDLGGRDTIIKEDASGDKDTSYRKETLRRNMAAVGAAKGGLTPSFFCGGGGGGELKSYEGDKGFGVVSGLGENDDVRSKNDGGVGGVGSGETGVSAGELMGANQESLDREKGQVEIGKGLEDGEGEKIGGGGALGEGRSENGER